MMILRSSPPSPFGRKVKIAAAILGLDQEITIEKADPTDASDTIRKQNPLGKIPALIIEDGSVLHDSPVILEYLDHRAGGAKIIPSEPSARYAALTLQSLCDGVLDACLLQVYEGRWRPAEKHEKKWLDYQAEKVKRAFDVRPAFRRHMAQGLSEAGGLARRFRRQGAGVREDARHGLTVKRPQKKAGTARNNRAQAADKQKPRARARGFRCLT
jgi:glutathione S-transferase